MSLIALLIGCSKGGEKGRADCGDLASACAVRSVESSSDAAIQPAFKTSATLTKALPEAQQLELAYRAIFGDGGREVVSSAGRELQFEGGNIVWLGDIAVLLAPATDRAASATATGALGAFYLKLVDQKLEAVRQFPFAIDGSIGGNPPKWEISRNITDLPVVVSTTTGVWQGVYCATTLLTEIGPEAPSDMVSFRSAFDNTGNAPVREVIQSIKGRITSERMNKSFDVEFTGTRTFTHSYENHSGTYERQSDGVAEELPEC